MLSSNNRAIIACAGSGKTTRLVEEALKNRHRRIAIVTYTNFNRAGIRRKFGEQNSGIPNHVELATWFGFLLRECARPYQGALYADNRIKSIYFVNKQSAQYVKETNTKRHYFAGSDLIFSDKLSKFVVKCQSASNNAITERLEQVYTDVFIDEFQDLAGWDLELVRMLLESRIRVTLVGDPRQYIYSTNPSTKNQQYRGLNLVDLVVKWRDEGLCSLETMDTTYRCCTGICDFANQLWPRFGSMTSLQQEATGHDGVFLVAEDRVKEYVQRFRPQILRYDKNSNTFGYDAINFGLAKGLEFKRVLIIPTKNFAKYLKTGALRAIEKSKDKLHVAVTRASQSVAFVFDGDSSVVSRRWEP